MNTRFFSVSSFMSMLIFSYVITTSCVLRAVPDIPWHGGLEASIAATKFFVVGAIERAEWGDDAASKKQLLTLIKVRNMLALMGDALWFSRDGALDCFLPLGFYYLDIAEMRESSFLTIDAVKKPHISCRGLFALIEAGATTAAALKTGLTAERIVIKKLLRNVSSLARLSDRIASSTDGTISKTLLIAVLFAWLNMLIYLRWYIKGVQNPDVRAYLFNWATTRVLLD